MTILKIGVSVAVGLVLLYGLFVLIAINSLRDPPFDAPEVAPLGTRATFEADRFLETASGYLVAGVVGTSDPLRGTACSGRFALVVLDERGRATAATILSGIEQSRYCADRVDALLPAPGGGWVMAGSGVRDGGPSALFGGRSTDSLWVTFRLDARGAPVESFGDGGLVEGRSAAGLVAGVLFTRYLERITESGAARDDLVISDAPLEFWSSFEVEDDLLVAVGFGPGLVFRTFERDAPSVAEYRPLHALPSYQSEPTVELGTNLGVGDTLLLDGTLYAAMSDQAGTRINAVDPRRLRIDFGFNGTGAVRLPGHVTSTKLLADGPEPFVVAMTTIDRGSPGDRLHVLRLSADGSQDARFGGRVKRNGRDVLLDPGLDDALVDAEGRTVVLGGESTLVRLDPSGKLDPSFGDEGIVQLRAARLCELTPAAAADACRNA